MNKKPENEIGPPPKVLKKKKINANKDLVKVELSKLKKGMRFTVDSDEVVYEYVVEARDNMVVCLILSGEEILSSSLINSDTLVYVDPPRINITKDNLMKLIRELDPDWDILAILNSHEDGFFDCYMNGCKGFTQFSTKEQEDAINQFFSIKNGWSYELEDFINDFSSYIENYNKDLVFEIPKGLKIKIIG